VIRRHSCAANRPPPFGSSLIFAWPPRGYNVCVDGYIFWETTAVEKHGKDYRQMTLRTLSVCGRGRVFSTGSGPGLRLFYSLLAHLLLFPSTPVNTHVAVCLCSYFFAFTALFPTILFHSHYPVPIHDLLPFTQPRILIFFSIFRGGDALLPLLFPAHILRISRCLASHSPLVVLGHPTQRVIPASGFVFFWRCNISVPFSSSLLLAHARPRAPYLAYSAV